MFMNAQFVGYILSIVSTAIFFVFSIISATEDSTFFTVLFAIIAFVSAWFFMGYVQIGAKEKAVVIFMGNPERTLLSGLNHILWPFEKVVRFTTDLMEVEFRAATVVTSTKDKNREARLEVTPTMYFCWPEGDALIEVLKKVARPWDMCYLKDFFEEVVLEAVRTVGGSRSWRELAQDRKAFAAEVLKTMQDEDDDPIKQLGLTNVKIVIINSALPAELEKAITAPEVARLNAEASVEEAKGVREATREKGRGTADARKMLLDAIGDPDMSLRWQTLDTLKEMAQGTSNTMMLMPLQIMDALNNVSRRFGVENAFETVKKLFPELTDEMIQKILKMAKASEK